jgi:hypothetical protein
MNIPNFKPFPSCETKVEKKMEIQCDEERLAEKWLPWLPVEMAAVSAVVLAKNLLRLRRPGESLEEIAERAKVCLLNTMRAMRDRAE